MKKPLSYILTSVLMACILILVCVYSVRRHQVQEAFQNADRAIEMERDRQLQEAEELRMFLEKNEQ